MLVLQRRVGEYIKIGENIWVRLISVQGQSARIGIEAPRDILILRGELAEEEGKSKPPEKDDG